MLFVLKIIITSSVGGILLSNKFILIILLLTFCLVNGSLTFGAEINDISPNYKYYNECQFYMGNSFLPVFIDNSFQPKANLNLYQVVLVGMFVNDVTPNFFNKMPYFGSVPISMKSFPYIQTAVELKYLSEKSDNSSPVETVVAANALKNIFPKLDISGFSNDKELITREKFMIILNKDADLSKKISEYETNVIKKEKKVIGSAVNDFILGDEQSLSKIEYSKYKKINNTFEQIYWEVAISRDRQYQVMYEDFSSETVDLLTKRLNKALLYFYDSQFWQTIDECNLILKEDYKHIGALSLKGSAYYMLQNYENARKYWNKVLIFQPNNEEIKYFLEML